ncbi:MAG TPA: single-stranded-DNA-specific exonuclease RecJ [Usitatibacteraceae bacterium]|nr:single-stranded-DNA-specific exonuclease RecJ [Usitatibacteraceae bacterium]
MPDLVDRPVDAAALAALTAAGVDPRLARLYAARGVQSPADLDLQLASLLSPDALSQAATAARFLAAAIEARRRLLIVADYDADGATACAVGMKALAAMGAEVDFIVPNRFEFGYGLTPEIVALAAERNPHVLITVDNGISSVEGVAEANRRGIEVLVTDHHLPGDALPDASVIVNPNQHGDGFASKHLAGVGVIFYVMLALRAELRRRGRFEGGFEPNLADLLDLVALGTVADVVRLDHNNRVLVEQGLQRIRAGRGSPGILALLAVAGRDPTRATTYDLGFVAGPRLNAAGRLDDMATGIRCLLAPNRAAAVPLADQLDRLNRERREIEADMKASAFAMLDTIDAADRYTLSLFQPDWHQGVVGLVAGRVKDRFNRPAIAFAPENDGQLKGSGRSVKGFHLRDALDLVAKRAPGTITRFGGHAMAAGLSIPAGALAAFEATFEAVAREWLTPADLALTLETDGTLDGKAIDFDFVRSLERGVWGQGFAAPSFHGELQVLEQRVVGERHSKLKVSLGGSSFEAMRFGSTEPMGGRLHAVFRPTINVFRNSASLQLTLDHLL